MIDLEDRVRQHVRTVGLDLPVTPASAQQARLRGDQLRRRRRIGTATGLAVVVALAALGTAQLLDRTSGVDLVVGAPGGPGSPTAAGALSWQRVDPVSALAYTGTLISSESGTLYALSTAPGELAPGEVGGQSLYRSNDGLEWVEVNTNAEMTFLDLASVDGRLYAIGTAAATAPIVPDGVGDAVVAWSADGGETWEQAVLPLDLRGLRALRGVAGVGVATGSVATTPFGVLVGVTVQGHPDVESLVPSGTDLSNGWGVTPDGIDVYAESDQGCGLAPPPDTAAVAETPATTMVEAATPNPRGACADGSPDAAASFTWADLGVEAAAVEVLVGSTNLFLAPDGVQFSPVDLPVETGRSVTALELFATDDRVMAATTTYDPSVGRADGRADVFASTDGRTWTVSQIADFAWVMDVGTVAGRLAVAGYAVDGVPAFATSADGSTWTVQRLDEAAGVPSSHQSWITGTDIGPLGFVAGLSMSPSTGVDTRPEAVVMHTGDGVSWSVTPAATLAGQPVSSIENVVVGHDVVQATALVPADDQPTGTQSTAERRYSVARTLLVGTPAPR